MAAGQSGGSADKAGSDKAASDQAAAGKGAAGKGATGKGGPDQAAKTAPDGAGSGGLDDVKRKFREALDRKKGQHASGTADGAQATGKVHDAHGPASSRRSFRRKSGS